MPEAPGELDPAELLSIGMHRFLDPVVTRPATWRIILLALDGTPDPVREHVQSNRQRIDLRRLGRRHPRDDDRAARRARRAGADPALTAGAPSTRFPTRLVLAGELMQGRELERVFGGQQPPEVRPDRPGREWNHGGDPLPGPRR